jgi:hypothetical protein
MSGPDHRAWIEVDLSAVVENARTVARTTGARLLPVVKANAYGVGAVAVSGALETVDPGVRGRHRGRGRSCGAGIGRPLLVSPRAAGIRRLARGPPSSTIPT